MKLNIRGSNIVVTDPIKKYAYDKIGRLDKYFKDSGDATCNIVFKVRGIMQISEVTITLNKLVLRAECEDKDLYASIDLVSEKLEAQLRKNKAKLKSKLKHKTQDINIDYIENPEDEIHTDILKRKTLYTDPISEEEAMVTIDMLDHSFFVFKNSDRNNNICVLYKRKDDNNYGIIEVI